MKSNRLQQLLSLLNESPNDSFLLFAIAKEYEKAGDDPQALKYYQLLETTAPDYVGLYYHLGKLYERQGAYQTAFEKYNRGIEAARKAGDRHAEGELATARMIVEEDYLDD